jgi:hypothetical protein
MAPRLAGWKHSTTRGMIHDGQKIVNAVNYGQRSIMNIQSNGRRYGTARALGNCGKQPPSGTTVILDSRCQSSDSIFRRQSILRTLSTQSARMNSLPNRALQMPGFNLPLNFLPEVSIGRLPFIYVANLIDS